MKKYFILNADDFGLTKENNEAVFEGNKKGVLKSASFIVNTEGFIDAVNNILPNCKDLSLGVHLNVMEGKSLTNCPLLTDGKGFFKRGYLFFILNMFNKKVLDEIEKEFEAQIKKAKTVASIEHIDSHVHTHGIPPVFNITSKLAKKYEIEYIRTQLEKPYITKLNFKYLINFVKIVLLDIFSIINKKTVEKYGLKTNDFLTGVGYSGMMDNKTVILGAKNINNGIVETLFHPSLYNSEFKIANDINIKKSISGLGFEFTNYKNCP